MNWVIGIDMYTLMWIKWMTNENLLYKKKFYSSYPMKEINKINKNKQMNQLINAHLHMWQTVC